MLEHEHQRKQNYYHRLGDSGIRSSVSSTNSNKAANANININTKPKQSNSMSRYMQNKISKSTLQVIDSSEKSDNNYTEAVMAPTTPPRWSKNHTRSTKQERPLPTKALLDDAIGSGAVVTGSLTSSDMAVVASNPGSSTSRDNNNINTNINNNSHLSNEDGTSQNNNNNNNNISATQQYLMTMTSMTSMTSNASSGLCLPLPTSKIPHVQHLYGRTPEMTTLHKRLSQASSMTCLTGVGGIGKTHLAAAACQQWLDQKVSSRFVVWINAATEFTLRVSYLEALQQVLMGNVVVAGTEDSDANNSKSTGLEAAQQGEIIIVAELLHRQLRKQRRKEQAKEALREKQRRHRKSKKNKSGESRDDDEDTTRVFSEDTEDWTDNARGTTSINAGEVEDDDDDSNSLDHHEQMDTKILAQLLWDSLLQGISPQYEWIVVFQNVPGGMGGIQGPPGLQPYFFPIADTPIDEWEQGRILCTTRHATFAGTTCLGTIVRLKVDQLDEQAACKMLIAQAVFGGNHASGRENLMSSKRQEILKEAECIAKKLVGPHYLDGSPLMITTAVGHIVSARVTLREYYSNLKHQVAVALEMSGYGTGKVQSSVKRETAMSVCLEQAMDNAHAQDLADIVSIAAFVCADNIPLKLLGGDSERVEKLCQMNLLSKVGKDVYSMHRVHQRTAVDAIITISVSSSDLSENKGGESEDSLCTPDSAVLALRSVMASFVPEEASTWRNARSCIPHVEAIRIHHDLLERKKQLSPSFNHAYYAEIINSSAGVLQWAMKDRPTAFTMFQEALRLRKHLFFSAPASLDLLSTGSSSNMKSDLAGALTKTLASLGSLADDDEVAQKYYKEAFDLYVQTFGQDSKSIESMTLCISLADVEAKLLHNGIAYDLYKKALELYFTIYGHNQNIYADDQKMFLAETLQKIGSLAHHQMNRHAEAELYLEGTITLLRHVFDGGSATQRDDMANALETLGSICHAQNRMSVARHYYKNALKMKNSIHGDKKWTDISNKYGNGSKDSGDTSKNKHRERGIGSSHNSSDSGESSADGDDRSVVTETFDDEEYAVELVRIDSATRDRASAMKDIKLARTLHRLGVMAWNLGSMKQAEEYFEKALSMQYSGYGKDALNEDMAITLFSLGGLCNDLHNNQEKACSYYQKALDCYDCTHGKNAQNESIAQLLHALGQSSQLLGKHHQAKVYLKKALDMKYVLYGGYDKLNPDLVSTLLDLGKVSRDLSATEDARHFYKTALKGLYMIHGRDASNAQLAATLTQLGGLSFCSGLLADAKKYFQRCLDMKLHLYGKDAYNDDLASTFNNMGSLHAKLRNQEAAFMFFELALDQYNKMSQDDQHTVDEEDRARTLHNLGLLSFNLQRYEEAKKFYSESLKLKSEVFKDVDDSPDLAITLTKLSSVATKQGHADTAKYYQDQAIKRSHTFLETHKNLINKNLLPETPEEAAAMMSLVPSEGNTDTQMMLKSMDLWGGQIPSAGEGTKTCWYPFKNKGHTKKDKKSKSAKKNILEKLAARLSNRDKE